MGSGDEKPYVAVVASPGLGHVIPFLEFSKRLITNYGCHVTFLKITTTNPSPALDELLQSPTLPPELHIISLPPVHVADIVPEDAMILTQISLIVKESLTKSLKAALNPLPKAVIVDMFCTDAFDICNEVSVPVYLFFTCPTSLLAFSLYLPELDRAVEGELVDLPEPIKVPGCRPVQPEDILDQVKNQKNDEYKWYLLHASRWQKVVGIFLNTWEGLEPVSLSALRENRYFLEIPTPPIHPIGPLIRPVDRAHSLTPSAAACLTWLDKQPLESVLFICFGSGGTLTTEQLTELAWGLELSQHRFVWVVRAPTDFTASGKYFTAGDHEIDPNTYLPKGFVERISGLGLVVPSWAPQMAVLQHSSTGAFLSHCGWNSTLESISNGVPMIAWPLFAEQRMNAAMVEEVGVAVWPGRAVKVVVKREQVTSTVRAVMEGEEGIRLKQMARELKDSAAKALSHGGTSMESFSRVCKDWK